MHASNFGNSVNIAISTNNVNNEKLDIPNNNIFKFLQDSVNGKTHVFKIDNIGEIDYTYQTLRQQQCKLLICILMKDDTYYNSILLEKTFEGIKNNIRDLQQISIEPENILICVFFNESKNNCLFNEEDMNRVKDNEEFILAEKVFSYNEQNINVHCITKMNHFSDSKILKFYYTFVVKNIRINDGITYSSVITAGVSPAEKSFINLIKLAFNARNQHAIVVPELEEEKKSRIFLQIKQYERFHFNLYNMNFYEMSASVPISSLFNVMAIGNKLYTELIKYYDNTKNIYNHESIDYHDYNLSLNLFCENFKIIYYNVTPMGKIYCSELNDTPFCDYETTWVQRYSGYYGNFFMLTRTFLNCGACNIGQKLFLFFHIIGLMMEFIFPSFFAMVTYTIFYEAFNIYDTRPATFCTLIYLSVLLASGACSLISSNAQRMSKTNVIFFMFVEIYYVFILICSIIAMDNVKKNKDSDPYKFNTAAISCIIIFTFIPSIIPMLMKASKVFENFIQMILYLLLGAASSSSYFHIAKILNAAGTQGGIKKDERKGIIIIAYFFINLLFCSMTFFNYNRKKRVDAVMGLGIFYLIYNFFKCLAISISIIDGQKKAFLHVDIEEDIKKGFSPNNYNLKGSNQYLGESSNNYNMNYNNNYNYNNEENNNNYNNEENNNNYNIEENNNNYNIEENNNNYNNIGESNNNYNNNNNIGESNKYELPSKNEVDYYNNENNNEQANDMDYNNK